MARPRAAEVSGSLFRSSHIMTSYCVSITEPTNGKILWKNQRMTNSHEILLGGIKIVTHMAKCIEI
jgi:hypothetical protein